MERMAADLENLRAAKANVEQNLADCRNSLTEVRKTLSVAEIKMEKQKDELERCCRDNDQLSLDLKHAQHEVESLRGQNDDLRTERGLAEERLQNLVCD